MLVFFLFLLIKKNSTISIFNKKLRYILSSSGRKRVIILLDISASMLKNHNGKPMIDIAKKSSIFLIESLTNYD